MSRRRVAIRLVGGAFVLAGVVPWASAGVLDGMVGRAHAWVESVGNTPAPAGLAVDVGFSPEGSAEALVLRAIHSAHSSIRLAGYTFTSPAIVRALVEQKRRGVDVAVVVDYRNNLAESKTGASRRALDALVAAGIPTRTVSVYPIHHDKYMVVDGLTVETGSFNYTYEAAKRNSENVVVIWNDGDLAGQFIQHWQSRWNEGRTYIAPSN